MSYIKEDSVYDEVFADVRKRDDITKYMSAVDRKIELLCSKHMINRDQIPVDDDGYTTSNLLIDYGINMAKYFLFSGYNGSSDGDGEDIYKVKKEDAWKDAQDILKDITHDSILGVYTDEGTAKGKNTFVKQVPIGGRG